jgi:hypothetical protein
MNNQQLERVVVEAALTTAEDIINRKYALKVVKDTDCMNVYHDSQKTMSDGIQHSGKTPDPLGKTATLDKNGNVATGRYTSINKRIKQDIEKFKFNYLEVEFIRMAIRIANDLNVKLGVTQDEIKRDTILAEKLAVSHLIEERL